MALLLKIAAVLRDFPTGSVSAMNSGMQSRQAKEQVATTQGRKKCDGEFCGGLNHRCGFLSSGGSQFEKSTGEVGGARGLLHPGKSKREIQRRCQLPANRYVSRRL